MDILGNHYIPTTGSIGILCLQSNEIVSNVSRQRIYQADMGLAHRITEKLGNFALKKDVKQSSSGYIENRR